MLARLKAAVTEAARARAAARPRVTAEPTALAAAWAFVAAVAASVERERERRAFATAWNRVASTVLAAAAASALPMRTNDEAICIARRSMGRLRAARSRLVPTIAGIAWLR